MMTCISVVRISLAKAEAPLSGYFIKRLKLMAKSYKNYSSKHILEQSRNINYTNGAMMFGFYNTITVEAQLVLDTQQIFIQADVFARQILLHRSLFDLKRFLGQYQDDWQRILMEAYVYDRLKAIFYGIYSINMLDWPEGLVSFPGNILLSRLLARKTFLHTLEDQQPTSLNILIKFDDDVNKLFEDVFSVCPSLKEGFSTDNGVYTYVNSKCESVLRGLFNGNLYLRSRNNSGSNTTLYSMYEFNTDKLDSFMKQDTFPFLNGVLKGEKLNSWYFYIPDEESGPNALRFNESVFIGRGIGLSMKSNVSVENNNLLYNSKRNYDSDPFTRDEVYAITALKSEIVPYSMDVIKRYLSINSYQSQSTSGTSSDDGGGNNAAP